MRFWLRLTEILSAGVAVLMAFAILTILMNIVEIILAARHKLGPVANIVMQSIKSAVWTVYFVLTIIGVSRQGSASSGLSIIMSLVLLYVTHICIHLAKHWLTRRSSSLACIAQLIYGAVIVHRHRKGTLSRGNYSPAEAGHSQVHPYTVGYDQPPTQSYTAYNPQGGVTPAYAAVPTQKHGAAANDYYGAPGAYEMQGNTRY